MAVSRRGLAEDMLGDCGQAADILERARRSSPVCVDTRTGPMMTKMR